VNDAQVRVALTFDAEHPDRPRCPPDAPARILDALASREVRATFFIQGRWAEAYPDIARRIADEGHLVGHHSKYHARMPLLHDDGIREDVREGATHIREATGADPRPWFRCPFGTGAGDPRVLAVLGELGYRNVHWDLALEDWEPARTADEIVAAGLAGVRSRGDGAVMLLHTWPGPTAEALPRLLEGLVADGASFVTVAQLERLP
jgi:peptidoglycan/xylan/chitin deacetylase (PgdA/CDA1 family)